MPRQSVKRVSVAMACAMCLAITGCGPDKTQATDKPSIMLTADSTGVPECETHDGSTQLVCWAYDEPNGLYVHMDYGRYTYVSATREMHDWQEG